MMEGVAKRREATGRLASLDSPLDHHLRQASKPQSAELLPKDARAHDGACRTWRDATELMPRAMRRLAVSEDQT